MVTNLHIKLNLMVVDLDHVEKQCLPWASLSWDSALNVAAAWPLCSVPIKKKFCSVPIKKPCSVPIKKLCSVSIKKKLHCVANFCGAIQLCQEIAKPHFRLLALQFCITIVSWLALHLFSVSECMQLLQWLVISDLHSIEVCKHCSALDYIDCTHWIVDILVLAGLWCIVMSCSFTR